MNKNIGYGKRRELRQSLGSRVGRRQGIKTGAKPKPRVKLEQMIQHPELRPKPEEIQTA
jgi:hypothetical protein